MHWYVVYTDKLHETKREALRLYMESPTEETRRAVVDMFEAVARETFAGCPNIENTVRECGRGMTDNVVSLYEVTKGPAAPLWNYVVGSLLR